MVSAPLSRLAAPLVCLFALLLLLPFHAQAQEVPRILSYQGQLLEDETTPVEGAQEVTFRLHPSASGSSTIGGWEETRTVEPVNGVFSVLLGNTADGGTALPAALTDQSEVYLGVAVNGTEIDRVRLTSTVFALGAARAQVAGTAEAVAEEAAVTSLRGRTGAVGLSPGSGIRFEEEDNTIRIIATGGSDDIDSGVSSITAGAGLGASDGVGDVEVFIDEVTAELLATAAVLTQKIADGAVTADKLADEAAVLSLNDARGALQLVGGNDVEITRSGNSLIVSIDIPEGVLTEVAVDGETITGDGAETPLAVGTVGSGQIAADAITADKLAADAVDGRALQDGVALRALQAAGETLTDTVSLEGQGIQLSIDEQQLTLSLAAGAVTETTLADGAVTRAKLAAEAAVTRLNSLGGELTLRATGGAEISENPEDGTITINAGSGGGTAGVTSIDARGGLEADPETGDVVLRISDRGVAGIKLADGAVSTRTLADEAVVERAIEDGAITGVKVASGAIARTNIANNAINTARLADGAVTGVKIDEETIQSGNIASGAITNRTIADGAVTSSKLSGDAVVTSIRGFTGDVNLEPGTGIAIEEDEAANIIRIVATGGGDDVESGVTSITAGAGLNSNQSTGDVVLEVSTITTGLLGNDAVTTAKLDNQAVSNAKLASNAVSSTNIQDEAVGSSKIADNAVTTAQLALNAVETGNIVNQAVTDGKLANDAVTSSKLRDGTAVRSLNGATDTVTLTEGDNISIVPSGNEITISAPQVGLSAVQTESPILGDGTNSAPIRLQSSGITADFIGNNAVTTNKIETNAVTNSKLSTNAVRESNVQDDAITASKIADGAVDTDQLAPEAVTTSNIGAGQVTANKLAADAAVLSLNTLTGGLTLQGGTGVDITPSGGNTLTIGVDFPEGGLTEVATDETLSGDGTPGNQLSVNEIGSDLIAVNAITSSELDNGAVQSGNIQAGAVNTAALDGDAVATENIQDNAITSAKIGSGEVTGSELANGAVDTPQLADDAITSAKIGVGEVTASALANDAAVLSLGVDGEATTLTGEVTLVGTNDVTLSQNDGGTITIDVDAPEGGLTSVSTDDTIEGNGTSGSPLSLASNAVATANLENGAVTGAKAATGFVTEGANISVTRAGGNFVVAAPDVLTDVNVDESTIVGDGEGTPLSVGTIGAGQLASDAAVLGLGIGGETQLTGDVTLIEGTDVTLSQNDGTGTITINVDAPDGGLTSVETDGVTIEGDGTDTANALSIIDAGVGTDQLANATAVRSLNGLQDVITLGGDGIGVTPDGSTDTITLSIENEAIATAQLADDAITSAKIGLGEVTGAELAANAVATNELADNTAIRSITADGATLSDEVTFDASGDASIAVSGNTITFSATAGSGGLTEVNTDGTTITGNGDGTALSVGTIGSAQIAENAITTTELDAGAVQTGNIANGAVGTTQLDDAAVTADKLEPGAAVRSLSADGGTNLTDAVNLIGGTNVTLNQVGQDITINASGSGGTAGVETLNELDGALELVGDGIIALSSSDPNINLSIADNSITETQLAPDAVTSAIINDGAVGTTEIENDAVTSAKIGSEQVTATKLAPDAAVLSLSADSGIGITGAANLIGGANVTLTQSGQNITIDASGSSGTAGVETLNGLDGTLSLVNDGGISIDDTGPSDIGLSVAENAITGFELADNTAVRQLSVGINDLTENITLDGDGIALDVLAQTVPVSIADGAVGNLQLADDAVQAANISAGAVGTAALADDAVTDIKISDGAITSAKIADDQVTTTELAPDAVQEVNILDGAVTAGKLDGSAAVLSIQDESVGSDVVSGGVTFTSSDNTVTISADQVADEVDFIVNQAELTTAEPSAARYKEAVEQLENPAELLAQLRGVRYQWIEDGRADVGMIADEVAEVLPELVTFNDAGEPERLHYARLVAVLVEAAKEQQATVTQQQEQIDAMEARIARLERMVTQMAEAGN